MEEVEILWTLKETVESAKKKLQTIQEVKNNKTEEVTDEYFTHDKFPELKPTSEGALLGALRIRTKHGTTILTYKKDVFIGERWSHSDEHETKIESAEQMRAILAALGFEPLVTLRMHKHSYTTPLFTIVLEEVKDIGNFIEIESRETTDAISERQARIRAFLKDSNILVGEELNVGKPEYALRQKVYETQIKKKNL